MRCFVSIIILGVATNTWSAYHALALQAEVISVVNITYDGDPSGFSLLVRGGSGSCADGSWVSFKPNNTLSSSEAVKKGLAIALLAKATGKTVNIYSYGEEHNCYTAAGISIND
jgi:hypothetical protein